ncbi:hypothetical protein [Lysinibacillus xylanilyticus]|uniref:hypothetical protein n=1 Tax=Lysinibacillus xylanilyticus TaxID=582475 RepID=UPI00382DF71B
MKIALVFTRLMATIIEIIRMIDNQLFNGTNKIVKNPTMDAVKSPVAKIASSLQRNDCLK